MRNLTMDRAKCIYRAAIDGSVTDAVGEVWWNEVIAELSQVVRARTAAEAAKVIGWWHHYWSMLGDTATAAARRIRAAARALAH